MVDDDHVVIAGRLDGGCAEVTRRRPRLRGTQSHGDGASGDLGDTSDIADARDGGVGEAEAIARIRDGARVESSKSFNL
jgi:hypothetical protein